MKFLVQRVKKSLVKVDGKVVGKIDKGYNVLIGISKDDDYKTADKMVRKLVNLRIFNDENDKMNLSIKDVDGEILAISQFTLCANLKDGNRPSFIDAGRPEMSKPMYEYIVQKLKDHVKNVETGIFGADMKVEILNDGPVTIIIDSEKI